MDPDGRAVQTRVASWRRGMQIRPTAPIPTVRHTADFWRQSMPYRVTLGVLAAALLLTTEAAAQTAQRFSIQLSARGVQLTGGNAAERATVVTRPGLAIGLG